MTLARQILEDKKLRVNVVETFDASVPAGTVVSQDPEGGAKVKEERLVTIHVSKGGESLEMPDLKGLNKSDAEAKLKKMGLKVGSVYERNSDEEAGTVIATDPKAGSKVTKGQSVDITVSKGKKETKNTVPDVTNLQVEGAKAALTSAGFKVSVTKEESSKAAGTVISQTPAGGSSVTAGSTITLVVAEPKKSSGKDNGKDNGKQEQDNPSVSRNGEGSKSR